MGASWHLSKKNMKKIYLDIDGVLIGKSKINPWETCLANYVEEFLDFCLQHFKCYWLSSHSRYGEIEPVVGIFNRNGGEELIDKVKSVHSYDCPCIVSLPILDGNRAFLDWIAQQTK